MGIGEFELIERYFKRSLVARADVVIGIGDDAAVLQVAHGDEVLVCVETLSDRALSSAGATRIGHLCLALPLTRLVVEGAQPAWATLGLTLPVADQAWLERFSEALFALAQTHDVALIGGDTTQGPVTVTVVAHGTRRRTARASPLQAPNVNATIYMAARLAGDATGEGDTSVRAPVPIALAERLRARAIRRVTDIGDGLVAALKRLLGGNARGASLDMGALTNLAQSNDFEHAIRQSGDVGLCFVVSPNETHLLSGLTDQITAIGRVDAAPGIRLMRDGRCLVEVAP